MEVAVHFTGEVISTSERRRSFALPLLGTLAAGLRFGANCSRRRPPTGGKSGSHHLVAPEGASGSATYIKPARPQRAPAVFMRYLALYGAHGVVGESQHQLPPLFFLFIYLFSEVQKTRTHTNKLGFGAGGKKKKKEK